MNLPPLHNLQHQAETGPAYFGGQNYEGVPRGYARETGDKDRDLINAVHNKELEYVKSAIARGADVNVTTVDEQGKETSVLYTALEMGPEYKEIALALLNAPGIVVTKKDLIPAMHFAVPEIIQKIIEIIGSRAG